MGGSTEEIMAGAKQMLYVPKRRGIKLAHVLSMCLDSQNLVRLVFAIWFSSHHLLFCPGSFLLVEQAFLFSEIVVHHFLLVSVDLAE